MTFDKSYIVEQLLGIPGFVLFLCFRGFMQAWTSRKLGDSTAYLQGYMTMNPTKHINVMGFIFLLLFGFGFSNPVPVNTRNFKNIKRDNAIQILSSPISGILLMFISTFLFYVLWLVGYKCGLSFALPVVYWGDSYSLLSVVAAEGTGAILMNALLCIMARTATVSVLLSVFFLLPLPGFDGYKLIANFLPYKAYSTLYKIEKYSMFIFIGFLLLINIIPETYSIVSIPANFLLSKASFISLKFVSLFL